MRHLALLVLSSLALSACVTPQVVDKPSSKVDFGHYKTIAYKLHGSPRTEYGSGPNDKAYGQDVTALFQALLGQRLEAMGYRVTNEQPDLLLDIEVTAAKPGSAAARFWVGFGAGRAVFLFDARFTDTTGRSLGGFVGGRSHTGMEFGQAFASREEIQSFAATRAVAQVEEFMRNAGAFEEKPKSKPRTGNPNS